MANDRNSIANKLKEQYKTYTGGNTSDTTRSSGTPRKDIASKIKNDYKSYSVANPYSEEDEIKKVQSWLDKVRSYNENLTNMVKDYQSTFGGNKYVSQNDYQNFLGKYGNTSAASYDNYVNMVRELEKHRAITAQDRKDLLSGSYDPSQLLRTASNVTNYMSKFRGEDDNKRIEEINEELKRYYNISRVSKNYLSNEELEYYQGLEKELSDLKSKPIYEKTGKYALQYSGINDKDLNNRLTEIRNTYKAATDENRQAIQDEYNWLMNNAQGKTGETVRKAWHEDTQARINDINKELQRFYSTQNKALFTKDEIQHFKDLERERDSLTVAVNNYKRGNTYVVNDEGQQQRVFLYGQDKYNVNREDPLFDTYAKRRTFDTSIIDEQEIRNRLNPENWHTEFDGKTYDQYGNEVTEAYINEWRSKTNAQDKLGVYLASSDEDKTQALSDNTTAYNRILNEGRSKFWHYLKDDEIDMYYYLLNKNGQQAALEFLDDMETELSRRDTEMMTEELREPASVADLERMEELNEKIKALKEKGDNSYAAKQELKALMQEKNQLKGKNFMAQVWDNVESVAGNIYGGILGTVDDMVHRLRGEDINPYSIWHRASNYSQAVRATTAEDLDKLLTDKQGNPIKILGVGLSDAYQSVMSLADMYAGSVLMGGGYGVSMGASAMASTARDLFEQGASGQDIFWGSLLAGVAEGLFEEYSLEKFLSIKDTRTRREWLMNILKQSFTEGSEEFFTEIANNVTDMFVRGTQSNAMQRYYEYRTQGDSEGTATWKALRDIGIDSWKAFVGGAISGGLGGMGRSGSQYLQYKDQMNHRATNAINQGNVQGIYDTAQGKNIDYSLAEQAYNRYVEEQSNKNENKAVKETANVLKQIDETRRNEQISDITTSLIEKGVSERQAKKMAPVISDVLERGYVTEEDDKVFRNNRDIALQVAQEARNGFAANRNFEYEARLEGDKETAEYIKNERIAAAAPKLSFDGTVNGQSSSFTYDHIDGDTLYVKTADGQVVNADDVQTTNRNAIQVMQDSVLFGDDGARAYLNGYEGGSASEYRQTFTNIYNQAKAGANVETLVSEMVAQGVSEKVARLAAYEGQNAYEAIQSNDVEQIRKYIDRTEAKKIEENVKQAAKGQETDIERENKEAEKKDLTDVREKYKKTFEDKHVHIKDVDWSKLDNKKQESIAGITMFIRALGRDVVIEGSIDYKNGDVIYRNAANAYFDPADNSYHFNVSMMDNAYFNVAIHESIHDLAKNNYAAYKQIRDKLIELCDNDTSGMMDDFAHELDRLMKTDTKGDVLDVAYEEWVANTVSGIFADPNTFSQFANRFMDEESRSTFLQLIDAIMDYIREAFDKIKTALGWRQTQVLENDLNALQEIREMLFQGYETIKNRLSYADKNASYDNLFQAHETNLTETELARYNEYAANALKGPGNNSERFVPVGEVSILIKEGLRKFGIELSDNSIHEIYDNNFRHLRKSHGIETEGQYGVTNGDIYAIPYIIAHPDGVYYCETTSGKKGILYVLNDVDSTYYVESVAVDGNLSGVQMMKSPLGVIPNQYKDTIVKEKALIALPNVQDHVGSSPQLYVQDVGRDHASINNIDERRNSVNTDVLENRAAEEFGTTYDWNETGYILTDGRRLDLSEKNNGGPRGHRSADHRIVGTLYEDLQGTAALVDFMNRGNIRITPETGGIDISVAPNKKQLDVLDSYISKNRGEVIVDISDEQGNNLYSWEYAKGTYSKKIINDITNFFKDGTQPKISDIARFRYSSNADVLDQQYEQAVSSGDMETAQRMVDEAAERAGYIPSNMFHGSMNATFHVFDKAKANPEGNSGAGFYFTTNREDAEQNYADVEGADNFFKTSALADKIFEDGEWNGIKVEDYDHAKQLAKDLLNKEPGTYEVYLKYDNPYYRDYRNSTDIYEMIMDDFDESVIDRDDYDSDEDYEDDLMYERERQFSEAIETAVMAAYQDLENTYEYVDGPTISEIVNAIVEQTYGYDSLTWKDILKALASANMRGFYFGTEKGEAWGEIEFTRAFIEALGYDAIYDKEVSTKFNQLNRNGREADHIIVFRPSQIKLSDPVTYDDQGNVIPLSKRFNTNKDDIRFSANIDSEGNKLSQAQQEYFADSKVRDKDGRLLLVYHGSPNANITVFDRSLAGRHTEAYHDKMIWFTDNEQFADTFAHEFEDSGYTSFRVRLGKKGKVYPGYLNMKKPFDLRNPTEEMMEYLIKNRAEMRGNDREYAVKDINSLLYEYGNHQMLKLYIKSMDDLRNMGYDGIIARLDTFIHNDDSLEYGIFESNQFKYADNKNPTENPDIRYSSNTEELDRIKAKKRHNMQDRIILRNAGEKLSEKDFYGLYSAARLRRGVDVAEQMNQIMSDGYYGDVVPASINAIHRLTVDELKQRDREAGFDDAFAENHIKRLKENPGNGRWSEDGNTYFPSISYGQDVYGGKKGDTILLIPENYIYKGERVLNGFKPFDFEVITLDHDFQEYYELYSKAYDEWKASDTAQNMKDRVDSENNTLSENQKKYFIDSKVRDHFGRLLVMYHGTRAGGFTIFDPRFSDDQISMFFTSNRNVARTYTYEFGNVENWREGDKGITIYPVYLNIKNPLIVDAKGADWNTIQNGDTQQIKAERKMLGGYEFASEDAYNKFYELMQELYDEDEYESEEEFLSNPPDRFLSEYYRYYKNNSKKTTLQQFFDNSDQYGWYDLYSLQRTFDDNGPGLIEIMDYANDDYSTAVDQYKEFFDEWIAENEEPNSDFYNTFTFDAMPLNNEVYERRDLRSTRWYAQKAKAEGYDGVLFENIYDSIWGREPSTVAIAFDSEQVKLVTNENPTENKDIRYSANEDEIEPVDLSNDTELHRRIAGLSKSDQYKEIKKYIFEKLANRDIVMSDGTVAIVDKTDIKHLTNGGLARRKSAELGKIEELIRTAKLYLSADNITHKKFNAFKYYKAVVKFGKKTFPILLNVGKGISDNKYHFYDITDKIKDIANPLTDLSGTKGLPRKNDIFNNNIQDIKQSVNMDSLNNADEKNVENLKQTIGDQYRLTVGKEMTMPAAEKIARDVTRRVNSKADKAELANRLKALFDKAAKQGKDLDTDSFMDEGTKILRGVLEQSATFDSIRYKADEPLRKYLRETGIALNELQQGEARYLFDSVANYRKALFGSVLLKNSGIPLDVAWQELNKMSAYLFPSDINDGDMVSYLYDAAKALSKANYYVNEYGFDLDGAAAYEFAQIVGDYTENKRIKTFVQQLRTYGKRYLDNEMKEIRKTRREKMAIQSRLYEEQRKRNVSLKVEISNLERQLSGEAQDIQRDITFLQSRLKYAEPGVDELSIREQIADLEQDKANLEARYREEIRNKTAQLQEGQEELEKIGKEYVKAGSTNTSLALDARKAAIGTKSAIKLRAQKEAQEIRTLQNNIRKKSSNLMSRLISGTDTKHVPENLREAVTGFLQAVDLGWNQGTYAAEKWLSDLNVLADKMAAANETNGSFQVDSMIIDQLREMAARITERLALAGKNLRTMSIAELNMLDDALSLVNAAIYNTDRLLADDRKQRASSVAERSIEEMGKKKQRKYTSGLLGHIENFFTLDQLDSFSYAERIGGPFKDVIFKNLRKAFDKKVKLVQEGMDAYNRAASVFGKTNKGVLSVIKSMSGKNAKTTTFKLDSGKTLQLNTAQIMELYLLNGRDQARIHLYNGGITVEEYDSKDGKVTKQEFVEVTEDDIDRITATLTKEQRKFANDLQRYASSNMSEWGNDVSMTLWGVKKFTERNYWPITVDDNTTDAVSQDKKTGNVGLYHLKNIGMSKQVNPNARNALVVGDIIDTYIRHVDEMTSYAAYTIPLDDAMKWYNYKNGSRTVQRSIESFMGKGGKAWFTDFIKALNNSQDMSGGMDFADTMIRNAKVAAISLNLRVVIQQPSAFARAAEVLDPKYLLKINNLKCMAGAKEAQEHSSIALWKSWGFRDVNVGKDLRGIMVGDGNWMDKLNDAGGWAAGKADDITWGALWNACKAEVEDKRPDLVKGSDEYYAAVDERFTEMIDRTQVVDSPFHRSKAMRSKNALWKMYTAFMSEPTKTYNMFYKTISNAYQGNFSAETRKDITRATLAFVAATILNSALAAIIDVGRDTDDEDWWEKYLKNMGKNMLDGLNPLNLIPVGKDIMSLFDGYEASRMDLDGVSDLIKQFKRAASVFTGEKNYNWWKIAYDTTMAASKVIGIPAGNIWRAVLSVMNYAGVDVSVFKGTWNTTSAKTVAEDMYGYYTKGDMEAFQSAFDKYVESEVNKMVEEDTKTLEETGQHKYDSTDTMYNKARKAVLNKLAQQLADNEEQIAEAYLAKSIGDGSEVVRIKNEYIAKGIPEEVFDKAVNLYGSSMNVQPEGVNELNSKLYSYDDLYAAIASGDLEDIGYIYDEMIEDSQAMNPEKAIKDRVIAEFKDDYYDYVGSGQSGKASQLENTLMRTFGLTSDDLQSYKTGYQKYAFQQKVPQAEDITINAVETYNTNLKGLGISEQTWYNVWSFKKNNHADIDKNGKAIDGSLRDKIFAHINQLNISATQKTALAMACGYGESSVAKNKLW